MLPLLTIKKKKRTAAHSYLALRDRHRATSSSHEVTIDEHPNTSQTPSLVKAAGKKLTVLVVLVRDGADDDADPRKNASAHDETRAQLGEGGLRRFEDQLRG